MSVGAAAGVVTAAIIVLGLLLALVWSIANGPTDAEVRATCVDRGRVQNVNGNAIRKLVVCRDGYFKTVR